MGINESGFLDVLLFSLLDPRFYFAMNIPVVSSREEFEDALNNHEKAVVFYFSAPWSKPCKEARIALEQCIPRFPGIDFVQVDYDKNTHAVQFCEVYGLPAFKVFKDGSPLEGGHHEGGITAQKLEQWLNRICPVG